MREEESTPVIAGVRVRVPMLAWMVEENGIEPHVPVWDKTHRDDGTLSSANF